MIFVETEPLTDSRPFQQNMKAQQMQMSEILKQNLTTILDEIEQARRRSPCAAGSVRLVAVTKYAQPEWVAALSLLHPVFGENRPQQLADRAAELPQQEWHLIGHLQRNKVRLAVNSAALIHSVDSIRLLQAIDTAVTATSTVPSVLLQVNLSRETEKTGFSSEEIQELWPEILKSAPRVRLQGLMTMAAATDDPEEARPVFRELRELRDKLNQHPHSAACKVRLSELSMGMSGDFVPAVEEGATLVRVGSRLFAGLQSE